MAVSLEGHQGKVSSSKAGASRQRKGLGCLGLLEVDSRLLQIQEQTGSHSETRWVRSSRHPTTEPEATRRVLRGPVVAEVQLQDHKEEDPRHKVVVAQHRREAVEVILGWVVAAIR